jgi:DNA-binding transcriptional regulator PaaX
MRTILRLTRDISNSRIEKEIEKVEQLGYLIRHPHRSGDTFELSKQGHLLFMTHEAFSKDRMTANNRPQEWDKMWRIVIFDITEEQRKERALLRQILKNIGFIYLQQSVWVYPFPCDSQILTLKDKLGLTKNAVYILAQYIEGDAKIKKHFNLK